MKKILIFGMIALAFGFASCSKEEPVKDVDTCIKKLNYFNTAFEGFMEDGVISKDTIEGEKSSEYNKIEATATEYYELINKINSQIADEKERIEKGKKIHDYELKHKEALEAKKEEIEAASALFIENLNSMKAE